VNLLEHYRINPAWIKDGTEPMLIPEEGEAPRVPEKGKENPEIEQ
jgi:hypothetical protein